jgi:hypothetical protein
MYRIFPKKLVFFAFAWIVIGIYFLFDTLGGLTHLTLRISSIPAIGWLLLNALLFNPVWRFCWRKIPYLQKLVFPDLNGKWKVELYSNWPRQLQLLEAAQSNETVLDMRGCPESDLAELTPMILEAEISQTWWSIEMKLYNPKSDTPIDKSNTISVDPFPRNGLRDPGICYIYKQENTTGNVSDDSEFYGAARLEYDFEKGQLKGLVWTARMWQRAMNTASKAVFTRIE